MAKEAPARLRFIGSLRHDADAGRVVSGAPPVERLGHSPLASPRVEPTLDGDRDADPPASYTKTTAVPNPSDTLYMTECATHYTDSDHFHFSPGQGGDFLPNSFKGEVAVQGHLNAANYIFVDCHVESRLWGTLRNELQRPGSQFVHPGGYRP